MSRSFSSLLSFSASRSVARGLPLVIMALAVAAATPVRGDNVSYQFGGTIAYSQDPSITFGSAFTGIFTIDTAAADAVPGLTKYGSYYGAVIDLQATVGSQTITNDGSYQNVVATANDNVVTTAGGTTYLEDQVSISLQSANHYMTFSFVDSTGLALSSDAMPTSFALGDWTNVSLFLDGGNNSFVIGNITSLEAASPVPLPAAAWAGLALMGATGLTKLRRRKEATA